MEFPEKVTGLLITILVAWLTARYTYRYNNRRFILEKREELYCDALTLLDKLVNSPTLMFTDDYLWEVDKIKARLKLLASKQVMGDFADMVRLIVKCHDDYWLYYNQNDPTITKAKRHTNEYGEDDKTCECTLQDKELFDFEAKQRQKEIVLSSTVLFDSSLEILVDDMHIDIGHYNVWSLKR